MELTIVAVYGLKVQLIVTETGHIVEAFFTPGACHDVLGLQHYSYDLPHGSVIYADKAYNDYDVEDALHTVRIAFKPLRKKKPKTTVSTRGSVFTTLLQKRG